MAGEDRTGPSLYPPPIARHLSRLRRNGGTRPRPSVGRRHEAGGTGAGRLRRTRAGWIEGSADYALFIGYL